MKGGDPITNENAGIYTFLQAEALGIYTKEEETGTALDTVADSDVENLRTRHNTLNLSLNISIKPLNPHILVVFVILGIFLQAGVLVFAAMSQYPSELTKDNDGNLVANYSFPVLLVGTPSLALGIFLCASYTY